MNILLAIGGGILGGAIMAVLIEAVGHMKARIIWLVVISALALAYLYA